MDAQKMAGGDCKIYKDVLNQEKIARFLVYAPTVSTAIGRQVRVTNANTASLDKALLHCDNLQY